MDYLSKADRDYLASHPVLKVGVLSGGWLPYWGGMGLAPQGIHHDYAMSFARELGVQIEYQGYDSIRQLLQGVKEGEVEMVIGFGKTPERANDYLFSSPLYKNVRVIWLRDQQLKNEPLNSLKWVCVEKTSYCEVLSQRGYQNIMTAQNYRAAAQMILQGLADATISNYVSLSHYLSEKKVTQGKVIFDKSLGTQINRVLFTKDKTQLKSIIDKLILAEERGLTRGRIHSKDIYFLNDQASLRLLFEEGREQVIRYTIEEETFPLSYRDGDGEVKGYVHDLLNRISMRSVLDFEYVPANGRDVQQMLEDGLVDLLPARNIEEVDQRDYWVTAPYTKIRFEMVETTAKYQKPHMAVLDRTGNYYSYLDINSQYKNIRVFRSLETVLPLLESGEVTHVLMNRDLINQLLIDDHRDYFKPLENHLDEKFDVSIAMVVRKDDPVLKDMLDSALNTFSPHEIETIQAAYRKVTLSFGYDKQQVIIYALMGLCFVLLMTLLFLLWWSRMRSSLRKTEKVVELSQNQITWLTQLLDTIPSMIYISDSSGRIVLSNHAYKQSSEQCVERGCTTVKYTCSFLNVAQYGAREFEEIIQVPASDCGMGERFYLVTRKAITHENGEMTHYLTLFNDISELKHSELALRESNRIALQAVEARSQFLAVVSHELRTPIAALVGLLELLSSRTQSQENQLLINNAIQSAGRLSLQVNEILDFSKIEAKQLQLEIEKYRMMDEFGPVLRSFEASAQVKGLAFELNWQPTAIVDAHFDALRVNQIISNLLSNAIKFTQHGKISVDIITNAESLRLRITDTGCGMTQSQLTSIFQPFVQADSTITRRFGGTGLGMSIVKSLLDLMNGDIECQSELGKGTQIDVTLPIKGEIFNAGFEVEQSYYGDERICSWLYCWNVKVRDDALNSVSFDMLASEQGNLYPDLLLQELLKNEQNASQAQVIQSVGQLVGHVLVVDDEPINRLLMQKQLNEIGVTSVAVADGEQAYERLIESGDRFDLLITDCHMPKMDGFELTKKVKAQVSSFSGKAVIGCTAEDSRLGAEKAHSAGMDKVIYKPYSLAILFRVLSKYLPEQQGQEEPTATWLDEYREEEREEMANVVIESFSFDIEQLLHADADVTSIAHRVKGAAGALMLNELAALAKSVEQQNDLSQIEAEKQKLIMAMRSVVAQATTWLDGLARGER
ncbi:transporter substrate-binding domain-containing protein [Vibrio sp. IRLE0018]|uniref:hybrid sensor histidine kinase/response regulator n=1 Tax=Vibrio floridensis TaxID=2908007 RepID=UPI001A1938C0|nr:transporter substrate-binding domain-containing protein [Vibrio floridensis]MCF8777724.1 transporter substrate-binding domain-containing protein [Vibrio floridensis]HAS6346874.1 transporter substrate-binding domain-containing protein [Vibrio vulnificus]